MYIAYPFFEANALWATPVGPFDTEQAGKDYVEKQHVASGGIVSEYTWSEDDHWSYFHHKQWDDMGWIVFKLVSP